MKSAWRFIRKFSYWKINLKIGTKYRRSAIFTLGETTNQIKLVSNLISVFRENETGKKKFKLKLVSISFVIGTSLCTCFRIQFLALAIQFMFWFWFDFIFSLFSIHFDLVLLFLLVFTNCALYYFWPRKRNVLLFSQLPNAS